MKNLRDKLFQYRSYTPIPFLIVMVAFAEPTSATLIVGGVIALLGEFIRFWGVAFAGPLTRVTGNVGAPELVVSGPFAYVRNPLYLGNILLYIGIGVMSNALAPWLVILAVIYFVFQYSLIVSLEEDFLLKNFREAYRTYKEQVPRFTPRLKPAKFPAQGHQMPDWKGGLRSEKRTLQAIILTVAIIFIRWGVV